MGKCNWFIYFIGWITSKFVTAYAIYDCKKILKCIGGAGNHRRIGYPFKIRGAQNITLEDFVNIGPDSTIYSTRAKLYIKSHVIVGPNLTVITGDHKFEVGSFIDSIEKYNGSDCDKDVIIENDVWIGSNVTILKGVHIGRGAIIAAGSIVTKDIPPYCISAGIPAKPIRMKWTPKEIELHESKLYPEEDRLDLSAINIL